MKKLYQIVVYIFEKLSASHHGFQQTSTFPKFNIASEKLPSQ